MHACQLCEKAFTHPESLKRHQKVKHEGKKFNCNKCENTFASKYNLKVHDLTFHEEIDLRVKCNKCDKLVSKGNHLRHQEWHKMKEEGLRFHCKECDKNYVLKTDFARHVRSVHTNKKVEPVIILDEFRDLPNHVANTNQKSKKAIGNHKTSLPKPKKGKWIVRLERIDVKS